MSRISDGGNGFLSAPHVLEYEYRRSCGPVLGRFFAGLRERRILGARRPDGRVLVPPAEYDPESGEALDELVEVGPGGQIVTWAWVTRPRPKQPLSRPFAWALIRLDGADAAMLHAVEADSENALRIGLRVRPRWCPEPSGGIRDIECFVPEEGA